MARLYVASSWRNTYYPDVLAHLRAAGFDCYDFRNPAPGNYGFAWSQIDPAWQTWTPEQFRAALEHPIATHGLGHDVAGLFGCDACVLVMPCGRSAHLEAGHALGAGKPTIVYVPEPCEPELMYGMCHGIAVTLDELVTKLNMHLSARKGGA